MPHRLIQSQISQDVVRACEDLLDGARSGQVTGLGVVVLLKRRRYIVDCLGEMARDPTFGRGALQSLDDCLRELVHGKADSKTTM